MERLELREQKAPCRLRPCDEADGIAIHEAATESIESVSPWMGWLTPSYAVSDAIEWAREAAADWVTGSRYEFVMIDELSGKLCGVCGLNRINTEDLVCNLGYWVRTSEVRRGIASAAARMLANFGTQTLGLKRIEIVVAEGNTASRRVAEKAGAVYEGIQRQRLRVGEVSHDAHMYACLG